VAGNAAYVNDGGDRVNFKLDAEPDRWDLSRLRSMIVGGAVIMQTSFDPGEYLRAVEEHRADDMLCVPTMAVALLTGATLLLAGRNCKVDGRPDGNWVGPTIFEGVKPILELKVIARQLLAGG